LRIVPRRLVGPTDLSNKNEAKKEEKAVHKKLLKRFEKDLNLWHTRH